MEQVTITLPMPPKGTSPNDRVHWAAKARAVKKLREWAYVAGLKARNRTHPWNRAAAQVTYYHRDKRGMLDGDNALSRTKGIWDGLQDAGLLADDKGLTHRPVLQEVDRKNPRVEVVLSKIGKYQEAVR